MSIQETWGKINPLKGRNTESTSSGLPVVETVSFDENGIIDSPSFTKRMFVPVIIVLVVALAFGLGRLSKQTPQNNIKFEYDENFGGAAAALPTALPPVTKSNATQTSAPSAVGEVVGSVKGTKYHYPYCPGAKQISPANKITFKDAAAAEAAGYTLALNCKIR